PPSSLMSWGRCNRSKCSASEVAHHVFALEAVPVCCDKAIRSPPPTDKLLREEATGRRMLAPIAALVLAVTVPAVAGAQSDLRQPAGKEWLTIGGDWHNTRYSTSPRSTVTT